MCNGMIESTSKAFWAQTSATKQSCLLLLLLTVVPIVQGSGKRPNLKVTLEHNLKLRRLCLHYSVIILYLIECQGMLT